MPKGGSTSNSEIKTVDIGRNNRINVKDGLHYIDAFDICNTTFAVAMTNRTCPLLKQRLRGC